MSKEQAISAWHAIGVKMTPQRLKHLDSFVLWQQGQAEKLREKRAGGVTAPPALKERKATENDATQKTAVTILYHDTHSTCNNNPNPGAARRRITMKRKDAFPKRYLTTADLNGPQVVVIDQVTEEEVSEGKVAPVIHFRDATKPLVCNVTNFDLLTILTRHDDSDDWGGARVELFVDKTVRDKSGKMVGGIRFRAAPAASKTKSKSQEQESADMLNE